MRMNQTIRWLAVTTGLALITSLGVAVPAQAAARDGICDVGEFCYYYNSDYKGSVSDFSGPVGDYGATQPTCYVFKTRNVAGYNACIKNNAASVWNRTSQTVRVHYNSNYGGAYQEVRVGAYANLNTTLKNNNASHSFRAPTSDTWGVENMAGASSGTVYWRDNHDVYVEGKIDNGRGGCARVHFTFKDRANADVVKWSESACGGSFTFRSFNFTVAQNREIWSAQIHVCYDDGRGLCQTIKTIHVARD